MRAVVDGRRVIVGRDTWGSVVFRRDGACYYVTAIVRQDYADGAYGKAYVRIGWSSNEAGLKQELPCKNL